MFDFFNRSTAKDYQQIAEETYNVSTPKTDSVKVKSRFSYSVGLDEENNTVLKLQCEGTGTTTLTLNQAGVRRLIRLLEATIPESGDDWK
jgi:hypothetical protein